MSARDVQVLLSLVLVFGGMALAGHATGDWAGLAWAASGAGVGYLFGTG